MFIFPDAPLQSENLLIRRVEKRDLDELFDVHSVEAVNRYLPYTTWQDEADAEAWWERVEERVGRGDTMQYVICDRHRDRVIGGCILFGHEPEHRRAELGYAIAQDFWGSGLMKEAMQRFLAFAFEDLGLRRIDAKVDSRNTPSSGLLLRLGFTQEGRLRQCRLEKGELVDLDLFGMLSHEWKGITG